MARTGVRNLLLYVLDMARVVMSNVTAVLPKDGGRSPPSAPPKGKKALKDSPALSPQRAAETEILAKRRAKKSKRQEALRETLNRFASLAMEDKETISSIWGVSSNPQFPESLRLPYGVPSLPFQTPPPPPAERSKVGGSEAT
ncbi:hypothetical protein PoB_006471000 [Plakobranchus ocellatus]|uniref:Uncharacterized protein n=1 Tax=Plakobranchus ocellatus TaxID=259542 RepID=A0AAV4D2L0_9GAST|nr:hypothetical protein PoB_006471000 [Plakobranchus ocellatus]